MKIQARCFEQGGIPMYRILRQMLPENRSKEEPKRCADSTLEPRHRLMT